MTLCLLVFFPFSCLRPYHDEMPTFHLLHESANELVASHPILWVGFCVVFVVRLCFVWSAVQDDGLLDYV